MHYSNKQNQNSNLFLFISTLYSLQDIIISPVCVLNLYIAVVIEYGFLPMANANINI